MFDSVRAGDKTAVRVVEEYAEHLSEGIANIVNLLQPELLCIGGEISRSGDILVPVVREKMRNKIYSRYSTENTKLVVAKLDNDAGIIGAAKLYLCKE